MIRLILSLPSPFGGDIRSELMFELFAADHELDGSSRLGEQVVPSNNYLVAARRVPAFVINLDRRNDR